MTVDGDLVQLVLQGDISAWETIVRDNQNTVFRLAYLLLGDADDAEDIAQETFIRAYHALARFELGRPIRPWLLRITINLTKNWRRSTGRREYALQRMARNDDSNHPVQRLAEQNLESFMMVEAIQKLKPPDQQIIQLRYFLECSENEISAVLGIAHGTVKSRLHRAVSRLRDLILEKYPELLDKER